MVSLFPIDAYYTANTPLRKKTAADSIFSIWAATSNPLKGSGRLAQLTFRGQAAVGRVLILGQGGFLTAGGFISSISFFYS